MLMASIPYPYTDRAAVVISQPAAPAAPAAGSLAIMIGIGAAMTLGELKKAVQIAIKLYINEIARGQNEIIFTTSKVTVDPKLGRASFVASIANAQLGVETLVGVGATAAAPGNAATSTELMKAGFEKCLDVAYEFARINTIVGIGT